DVVVQVLRKTRACSLLRVDESTGQLPNPLVARSKRGFARADRLFSTVAGSLHQESCDEHQLRDDDDDRAHDVRAIGFPETRRPEQDLRLRWELRGVDPPTSDLAPIEHRHGGHSANRNLLRRCTAENLARDLSETSSGRLGVAHDAADDARAQILFGDAVDRDWSGLDDQAGNLVRIHDTRGLVRGITRVEDQALLRDGFDGREPGWNGSLLDVDELQAF